MCTKAARCLVFLCVGLCESFAQAPPSPPSRRIDLDVVVSDKSGKPVSGLVQQDFTLLDNKQPQKILSFEAVQGISPKNGPPVEVILLIDNVNETFTHLSFAREEVTKFLLRDGAQLSRPVSLAFFSDAGTAISPAATQNGNALVAELNENKGGLRSITRSQGVYGASDRLERSINAVRQLADMEAAKPGRKCLIWISPGWPILTGPRIQLTSKDQEGLFNTIVGLSDSLRRARMTVYSIDPLGTADAGGFRTNFYEGYVKGVKKARDVQLADLALQVLAIQTGGRVFNSNNDVAKEIAAAVADTDAYYVLSFDGLPGDGPNEYHSIEVKLDKPGLKALTRTGYYAQP